MSHSHHINPDQPTIRLVAASNPGHVSVQPGEIVISYHPEAFPQLDKTLPVVMPPTQYTTLVFDGSVDDYWDDLRRVVNRHFRLTEYFCRCDDGEPSEGPDISQDLSAIEYGGDHAHQLKIVWEPGERPSIFVNW